MQVADNPHAQPAFQQIKDHIVSRIRAGDWKEGDLVPTELELARLFGVSRMTANRAMRELAAEQVVVRVQGAGTFVAQEKYQATLVQIRNIADEIAARNHKHRSELHLLERARAKDSQAKQFDLKSGAELFHSLIVHFEDEVPIQVEDRWVNKLVAPDYMGQDFTKVTPNEYLMKAAPLQGVQYTIEAVMPSPDVAEMLRIGGQEPCLVLHRKTISRNKVASVAKLWHPGKKYRFSGEF